MDQWHKTSCVMCAQNCGLEVKVEDNKMVKVRPDKDNPRSQGLPPSFLPLLRPTAPNPLLTWAAAARAVISRRPLASGCCGGWVLATIITPLGRSSPDTSGPGVGPLAGSIYSAVPIITTRMFCWPGGGTA